MTGNFVIEYDLNGKVIDVSSDFLRLMNCSLAEILGLHHKDLIQSSLSTEQFYISFWNDLKEGKTRDEVNSLSFKGKEFKLFETYIPKRNSKGYISKIISYLDVYQKSDSERNVVIKKAETDLAEKNNINEKLINIGDEQSKMMQRMQKIRERNATLLQELDDSMQENYQDLI